MKTRTKVEGGRGKGGKRNTRKMKNGRIIYQLEL
jgi:hypothetical protein